MTINVTATIQKYSPESLYQEQPNKWTWLVVLLVILLHGFVLWGLLHVDVPQITLPSARPLTVEFIDISDNMDKSEALENTSQDSQLIPKTEPKKTPAISKTITQSQQTQKQPATPAPTAKPAQATPTPKPKSDSKSSVINNPIVEPITTKNQPQPTNIISIEDNSATLSTAKSTHTPKETNTTVSTSAPSSMTTQENRNMDHSSNSHDNNIHDNEVATDNHQNNAHTSAINNSQTKEQVLSQQTPANTEQASSEEKSSEEKSNTTPNTGVDSSNKQAQGGSPNTQAMEQDWQALVRLDIERKLVYPPQALSKKWGGQTTLRVTINASGQVLNVSIVNGSGKTVLDREAQAVVNRASPLPKPPSEILKGSSSRSFTIPVNFDYEKYQ